MVNCAAVITVLLLSLLAAPANPQAAEPAPSRGPAAELGRRAVEAGLDPEECYHVRDLRFSREDLRLYLTEGYVVFSRPVEGAPVSAVFSAIDVEGGDAEILLLPPTRSERRALASFADTPNLDEHFYSAAFIFTDDTYAELMKQIRARGELRRDPVRGAAIALKWDQVLRNFITSFQTRVVTDLLGGDRSRGFFHAALGCQKLGNLDVHFDPLAHEQITLGRVGYRLDQAFFDVLTRFPARSYRNQTKTLPGPDLQIPAYRIDASLDEKFHLRVTTVATVIPTAASRYALPFDISSQMHVTAVKVNGEPAEVFQPVSLRSGLMRGDLNETFLVRPAAPLEPGREIEVEFQHEGDVISDAGNRVYFVGARGAWYPNLRTEFSRFDLTFRYPKDLDLVATGKTIEDKTDGEWRITQRRTENPVRVAGFNLGHYERYSVTRDGVTIEVFANRQVETALERPRQVVVIPPAPPGRPGNQRWTVDLAPFPLDTTPDPSARLQRLASELADGMDFMSSHFGPPILKWLTVAPIPGTFGQGFPGLIYLSTLAYLDVKDRPLGRRNEVENLFYSDIMHAHELAHQWWGNIVTTASYEDDWIMEALANYSALLYIEKSKGGAAVKQVLDAYKRNLLATAPGGDTVESTGPIIWGPRLYNSLAPNGWRIITYEKGSWIIHMLRRRMGDERFLKALGQFRQRHQQQAVSTDQFRRAMAEFMPAGSQDPNLENFFDQWVYGTGIPELKLAYTLRGKTPAVRISGTITQTGVDSAFSALVPVEIHVGRGKPIVNWVRTSSDPAVFAVTLKQAPARVLLDPDESVLRK